MKGKGSVMVDCAKLQRVYDALLPLLGSCQASIPNPVLWVDFKDLSAPTRSVDGNSELVLGCCDIHQNTQEPPKPEHVKLDAQLGRYVFSPPAGRIVSLTTKGPVVLKGSYTKSLWVKLNSPHTGFAFFIDAVRPAGAVASFATHHWRYLGDGVLRAYNLPANFKEVHGGIWGIPTVWGDVTAQDPKNTFAPEVGTNWHHYAVVYDQPNKTFTLYRDGVVVATAAEDRRFQGDTSNNQGAIDIGRFDGAWYDARLYDQKLSGDAIQWIMKEGQKRTV